MKLLDFDAKVAQFAAHPFIFEGIDTDGPWTHYPDLFVRRTAGSVLVLDVKNPEQIGKPRVQHQARRTATACQQLSWDYQMAGERDPQLWTTVEATFIYTGVDLKHSGLFLEGSGSVRVTQTAGRNTLLHMPPYTIRTRDEKAD